MEITIGRDKQFADSKRKYQIKVDGKKLTTISIDEQKTISLPANAKKIIATIDWGMSNEIDISTLASGNTLLVRNSFSHFSWIPFVSLYYSLFNRKKYLTIDKVQ